MHLHCIVNKNEILEDGADGASIRGKDVMAETGGEERAADGMGILASVSVFSAAAYPRRSCSLCKCVMS